MPETSSGAQAPSQSRTLTAPTASACALNPQCLQEKACLLRSPNLRHPGRVFDVYRAGTGTKEIFSPDSDQTRHRAQERHDEMDQGRFDDLLKALSVYARPIDAARRCLGDFESDRHRMRDPDFRSQGLCVSSRGGQGRVQGHHQCPTQTGWHALDRDRSQCDHRPALLSAQERIQAGATFF